MTTGYTIGGDTLQPICNNILAGQTFTPPDTHILRWVDLNISSPGPVNAPVILIFHADANDEPVGEYLSRDRYPLPPLVYRWPLQRARFSMQPVTLLKDEYYCIQVGFYPTIPPQNAYWQYDEGDAQYRHGIRISSDDHGSTWEKHNNDDHMFYEFGTPPVPEPPPDPPVLNFAILDMEHMLTPAGQFLLITTSIPCHLTLYITPKPPDRHYTPVISRGLRVQDATRWCFVSFGTYDQTEPGDTIFHSFLIDDWPPGMPKYFTFRSSVNGFESPSIGPIFSEPPAENLYKLVFHERWTRIIIPEPTFYLHFSELWSI